MTRSLLALLSFVLVLMSGGPAMAVEEPPHTIVEKAGAFELRRYESMVVAEVVVSGERSAAANAGFRLLANYIFGGNEPKAKIAMTAPVTQSSGKGETIAMTAPVTQAQTGAASDWVIGFVMPRGSRLETMPVPLDPKVKLRVVPERTIAALRFSGLAGMTTLTEKTGELQAELRRRGLATAGPVTFAFYDPPWTLPFMRRNEVMVEVAGQ
jgi:hypothetical protein